MNQWQQQTSDSWNVMSNPMMASNTMGWVSNTVAPGSYTATGINAMQQQAAVRVEAPAAVAVIDMPDRGAIETLPVEVKQEDLDDMGKQFAMEVESLLGYSNLRKEVKAPSPLRTVLAKLEIEVLNPEQVQNYKKQAAEHMRTAKKMSDPTWDVTPLGEYHQKVPHFVLSKALEVKKALPEAQFFVEHLKEDPFLIVTTKKIAAYGMTGRHGTLGKDAAKQDDVMYLEVWDEKSFEAAV